MTELRLIEGERPETLTEAVAKRFRGQLAERRIKQKDIIELTHWGKTTVYRKVHGQSPLDIAELDLLWKLFGISPVLLLTGDPDHRPWPGPSDDGSPDGAPTRARTWDLRIIRAQHAA
jgi:hypothetical protein